ncbi:hypothetical protein BCR32DRAFT_286811 [Anaeromyces robustus]|uniref:Uncharacterized protein n=1 Tax=Anaeromyces robustus TaxID=1754192 RepID=A0A1Y1VVS6_9FUNG|nr:hypothetical protein BCR32DRAFT_286811 [Anaeromyces robustus]|eukprot:ORX64864.1 hypothetical protein BCR32DRAFT_286811 [Anaeromyces robustus]
MCKKKDLRNFLQNNIKKENLSKYIKVRGDKTKVYHSSVTEEIILNDNTAKTLINNNINYESMKKLNFITSTAYEIYKTLSETYIYAAKLDDLIFDSKKSSLSMFISSMNNIFKELEKSRYKNEWKTYCETVIKDHQHTKHLLYVDTETMTIETIKTTTKNNDYKHKNNNFKGNNNSQSSFCCARADEDQEKIRKICHRLQQCIALSTAESEYYAIVECPKV